MRNSHPEADSGAQDGFSLLHRSEYLLESTTGTIDEMLREFGNNAGLIACG
jgi:hypothetical protein